jgi:hypothetical protein
LFLKKDLNLLGLNLNHFGLNSKCAAKTLSNSFSY